MQPQRHRLLIYSLLLGVWALVAIWQVEEHVHVRNEARAALVNRAKDISTTLGIVLRSQRRFGGVVSKERLEASLTELVKQESIELNGIALLNAAGEMVASAGNGTDFQTRGAADEAERWDSQTVTLVNPVDLGANLTYDFEGTNPPIIMSREEFTNRLATNRFAMPPPEPSREPPGSRPEDNQTNPLTAGGAMPPPPAGVGANHEPPRERNFRFRLGRPPWMSEADYQALLQKQGVHSFVIVMSTKPVHALSRQDFWLRAIIVLLATISAAGIGLAWRNVSETSDLQIRLVRASELNSHLREMNLAAAGLAHETRNPLNIIRGMAQMLSKQTAVSPEDIREKSRAIVNETDKVTAQLNEFINYSRPREVRRSKIALNSAITEVVRTLAHDIDEKKLRVETGGDPVAIEADEQLLRQVLFNLLLNAIQAVGANGRIQISARRLSADEAVFEIRDDGPGVPPEHRQEIFKPYFTTNQKGTGLGLAVVQQIVLAHGWEIECLANEPKGALFRITHLKIAA
ncbi:MAG TPA: ATP-binding protein [Candidatus Acidoferrales bacterium]|nr:ATP-binding protein [Candidatus Acidoferrales bacterium]